MKIGSTYIMDDYWNCDIGVGSHGKGDVRAKRVIKKIAGKARRNEAKKEVLRQIAY